MIDQSSLGFLPGIVVMVGYAILAWQGIKIFFRKAK